MEAITAQIIRPSAASWRGSTRLPLACLAATLVLALAASLPAPAVAARARARPMRFGDADAQRRFTVEQAISLVGYGSLEWSRDGRRLAFVVASPDTAENTTNYDIWVADARGGAVRRITRNPKGDSSPSFSPGGDTLAFVSTRGTGDEARQAIYMISLDGGEPWAFGRYDEAVGEVHWSPDGRYLAYTKNDTLPRAIVDQRRRKWDPEVEDERLQYPGLWVVEIATGRRLRLVGGPQVVWNARWSPDSRSLAYLTNPTWAADDANLTDIGVVSVAGGRPRMLGAIGAGFEWSPDSRWLAWTSTSHRDVFIEKQDLWVCSAAGGQPQRLTDDFDGDPGDPAWSPTSDTLYFHAAVGVRTALAAVPRAGGPVRLLADRDGAAGGMAIAPSGRTAWVESSARAPDEIVVAAHPRLRGEPLTDLNAGVAPLALGDTRTVRWTSSDGVTVEGLLLRPPGVPPRGPLKTLVLLHGGPYGLRVDLGFQWWAQFFAAAGYQVFMPNFRGSGGYGTAFMLRQRGDWGGQDWRDVSTGVDSLVGRGLVDPRRLGILGGSYGGYLTAWAITQTDRFKAAYLDRGIANLAALWGQSDTHQYRAYEFGGRPWESSERWRSRSPITFVARAKTPTLITVGDNDARTPIAQSRELYESLRSLGVPTQFVHYPREGHGLREPRHRADALRRARAWFDRWIR